MYRGVEGERLDRVCEGVGGVGGIGDVEHTHSTAQHSVPLTSVTRAGGAFATYPSLPVMH